MATIALGALGSYLGGPIGGAVGAFIGGVIDNAVINALRAPIRVGKLDELRNPDVDEGGPAALLFGPRCRVACQLIWMGPIVQISRTTGGGFFEGPRVTSYRYFRDVALAICRNETTSLNRVWVASDLAYDSGAAPAVVSDDISITRSLPQGRIACIDPARPNIGFFDAIAEHMHLLDSGATTPNVFSTVQPAGFVTITGAANAANNGIYRVIAVELDFGGVVGQSRLTVLKNTYTYSWNGTACVATATTAAVTESAGATISITQAIVDLNRGIFEDVEFYNGSQTQDPSPTIEAREGAGNVPAFRGTTYMVLKMLEVTKTIGQMPRIEAEVSEDDPRTIGSVIRDLLLRTGKLTSEQIDVTEVTGNLTGFAVSGLFSPLEAVKQLLFAYGIDFQQRGGVLRFFMREDADVITIADGDRGAAAPDEEADELLKVETLSAAKLPKSYTVSFVDPRRDLQPGARTVTKTANPINSAASTELTLTLTPSEATTIAKRALFMAHIASERVLLQVPPNYLEAIEGDHFLVNDLAGVQRRARVLQADRGAGNFLLKLESTVEDPEASDQSHTSEDQSGSTGEGGSAALRLSGTIRLVLLDLPPLADSTAQQSGILVAGGTYNPTADFSGYVAWVNSANDTPTYQELVRSSIAAVMGYTTTQLANVLDNHVWDRTNTVTVRLDRDEDVLVSVSEEECLAGANRILIGAEIIGFATATLTAPRTYVLSMLLRGQRNTENYMVGHSASPETVVLLSGPGVGFYPLGWAHNANVFLRGTLQTEDAADAAETVASTVFSRTRRPFTPYAIRATRDSAGEITLTWGRRTRLATRTLSGLEAGIDDLGDAVYEIDVRNDADTATVRTYTVTNATSWVYSVANQTTDYGGTKSSLRIRIYKVSPSVGRGEHRTLVV